MHIKTRVLALLLAVSVVMLFGCQRSIVSSGDKSKMVSPFGSAEDIAYSKALWKKLEKKGFNSIPATLYVGGPPHGPVREVLEGKIDGKTVIVKRNYGGDGVSIEAVKADRAKFLKAVTVMARREKGYDSDNNDWFWVKYKPNGDLHVHPGKKLLAGRIAKGMDKGCIACHKSASGTNMVFSHNETANATITRIK